MDSAVTTEPLEVARVAETGEQLLAVVENLRATSVPVEVVSRLLAIVDDPADENERSCAECALGLIRRQQGDFDASCEHFARSVGATPESGVAARARIYWAGVLARLADFAGADALLAASIDGIQDGDRPLLELQLGFLAELREHVDDAIEHYGRAIALGESYADTYVRSLALNNRANVRARIGQFELAELDLRSALVMAAGNGRLLGLAQHNLGAAIGSQGSVREALERIDRAAVSSEGPGIDGGQAALSETEILLLAGLFEDALAKASDALVIEAERMEPASLEVPDLLILLGRSALGLGSIDQARLNFQRAQEIFAEQDRHTSEAQCAMVTGLLERHEVPVIGPDEPGADAVYEALIALGDHEPAVASQCWLAATKAIGSQRRQLQVLGHYAQARLHLHDGDVAGAKPEAMALIVKLGEHTSDMNAVELRAALVFGLVDVEGLAVRLGAAGDPADMLWLIDRANTVVHSIAPLSDADAELAAQLETLRASISNSDPVAIDRSEVELLEARLRSLHRRMERTGAPNRNSIELETMCLSAFDERVVMFAEADGHLWRLVLPAGEESSGADSGGEESGGGPSLVDLGSRESLTRLIRRVRHASDDLARRPSPVPDVLITKLDRTAAQLDELLFGGVEIESGSEVTLFPGRFLTSVPWRVLPSAKQWQVAINAGTPLVPPDAEASNQSTPSAAKRALVVAGPDLGDGVAAEVKAVAAMYHDPIVLTGPDATVSAVLDAFETVDIAHVAGHGSLHARDPLMAMITLADGPLTVYDIEMAVRTPPLVVLASCLVGSGGSTGSEVSYGFASALASRGTKQLIISPVELDDDKTAIVMPELHRGLAAGVRARVALDSLRFDQLDLERVADSLLAVEAESFS